MSGLYPQVAELEAQNAALGGKAGGYSDERGPLVAEARLQVASDDGRCAGELHKKGGTRSGLLNRHNWSLRTFWVRTELADGENYELLYFKGGPDYAKGAAALRKAAKGSLPRGLHRRRGVDGPPLGGLEAEPSTAALAGAVKVKAKKDKAGTLFAGKKTNYSAAATTFQPAADPATTRTTTTTQPSSAAPDLGDGATCALRVEVDADAYPPQSAARAEFLDAFARDVAEALDDDDFSTARRSRCASRGGRACSASRRRRSSTGCASSSSSSSPAAAAATKAYEAADRAATRGAAVRKLAALVKDADSPLYEGDVACFVDRDFTAGLFGVEEAAPRSGAASLTPRSPRCWPATTRAPSHAKPGCVPPPFGSGRSGARRDDVTFTVYVTYKGLRKPLQASRLHAGSDYELVVDDSRMDAFDRISPSERDLEAKLAAMPGAVDDGAPAADLAADFKARTRTAASRTSTTRPWRRSKMDAALLEVAWIQTTLDPAKIKLF
ncbi:hypothetical protein JL720_15757 [Aureococcus anophagefferens]|nr:hypothetical protein JL720_15757 [Aureococcus anophagefferens]